MFKLFDKNDLKKLHVPTKDSSGEDNGQVTVIGGSSLFHGAPLFSLKVASRVVDMVFFASPEGGVGKVAERLKSKLLSFIWVPWGEIEEYVAKSDAVLIGPGFMRFKSEEASHNERHHYCDEICQKSKEITKKLLEKFPKKRWVIDAGSLQAMDAAWIPKNAVLTPNRKEFEMLFNVKPQASNIKSKSEEYDCTIVLKGSTDVVCSPEKCIEIKNGNPGLTKGGTGDVLAGLAVALLAKNEPFLAVSAAAYITKAAADELYKKVGTNYNAGDLADKIPETLHNLTK